MSYLEDFIHYKLAVEIDEDFDKIQELQKLIEESTVVDSDSLNGGRVCAKEQALRALNCFGKERCLSFEHGIFGWCDASWYKEHGIKVVSIDEFLNSIPTNKIQITETDLMSMLEAV